MKQMESGVTYHHVYKPESSSKRRKALIEHARALQLAGRMDESQSTMEEVHRLALEQYSTSASEREDPLSALERFRYKSGPSKRW